MSPEAAHLRIALGALFMMARVIREAPGWKREDMALAAMADADALLAAAEELPPLNKGRT